MNIPPIPLSAINNFIQNNLVNRITININNTQSRNTLHHGKHIGNKLITPLPVTINRREMGFIQQLKKLAGLLPMKLVTRVRINYHYFLLWVGGLYKVTFTESLDPLTEEMCKNDPDIPDESSINKYLKENGNKESDTLEFEEHSMIIDGSISDG
ncbi:6547_t:CDS:2 [Rhizophagus irregularis]|nr:6547_t:CDS:2 [Rhizophagus irregularis]